MAHPIVLIHGFPLDSAMWEAQERALRAAGHTVIVPDLPGFGSTPPWPAEQYGMERLADHIAEIVRVLPEKKAIIGGFSMGGYIALALQREHPDLVAGLMLIDTRADPDPEETKLSRQKSIALVQSSGLPPLTDAMLPRLLSTFATQEVRQTLRAIMLRQSTAGVIGALQAMLKRRDQRDLLAVLKTPALIVVGDSDVLTPRSVALAMHNLMPHAMLIQVARAGHMAPLEQPQSVNDAMLNFLTVHG